MYRFHDAKVDTNLFLQLQDLTTVLSEHADFTFEYSFGSFIDTINNRVTASRMWDTAESTFQVAGYKTDVYLRTLGTLRYSSVKAMKQYLEDTNEVHVKKFSTQLFALLEDIRLEEWIKRDRPGTKHVFHTRRKYLKHKFENELIAHATRGLELDELFCLIYLLIQSDHPDPSFPRVNEKQLEQLESIKPFLYEVFDAKNTSDIVNIAERIVFQVDNHYRDTVHEYFIFPIYHIESLIENRLFDELTRTDDVKNDDSEEVNNEDNEYIDEEFSTWHRENKNEDRKQTFLQFNLDVGTKTNIMGGGARETEDADQAMGTIQGSSGKSKKNDYSELESLEKQENRNGASSENKYGEENKHAVKLIKEAEQPSREDILLYRDFVREIEPLKRKLSNIIKKTIEHKKNAPRKDLVVGRLSKKLLPIILDENPRVFYKKNQESKEFDAVFTLLVDCSASMQGKMEETKRGIVLFHEVLKQFNIPHSIIGFWEDAFEVSENYQPNYFHVIHSFSDSSQHNNGAKIMQLEPQEDNRDGFSIRVATEQLALRSEKNKFLLIFSDGEPAASNYDQNGIVDTNKAVSEARKKGMEVIGMFLSDGEIDEAEDITMQNIYGRERLMIPSVSELPEQFAPLLKKLLLKTI
ncbi:VWA domain-containing protein [Oceanobacillus piezotolerans]|uniref:VWA domain-containing protein n=1 Tax=Oceanobacillus piezotolerans TaxID=2448030 RepID=A0A498D8X6_9BACI|nr:VWA domain-containing protein [Oceanobacillus piezotolerans]RLL47733.1 VWA domain-containing protein [Oceanobacillus piezotolerans]